MQSKTRVDRIKMRALLTGFLVICSVNILFAENFNPYLTYHCYKTESAIKIDGKLDEKAWKNTIPTPVFGDIVTGEAPRYSVKAKILWDEKYLYVAYEIDDPNVWAFKTIRDDPMGGQNVGKISGVNDIKMKGGWGYRENFIKLYIDPDADGCNYIEMHVSPLNKICDKWHERPWSVATRKRMGLSGTANPHVEWDCPGLKTAVSIKGTLNDSYDVDEGWTVEMAIPFSSLKQFTGELNCPPKENDIWRMHLGRRYQANPQKAKRKDVSYWTWPVLGLTSCHNPDRWGYVIFKDKRETQPKELKNLSKTNFKWKALWVRASSTTTLEDIKKMVELTDKMGFNVLIFQATGSRGKCFYNSNILNKSKKIEIDPLREVIKEAKKKKIKVYVWTVNLCVPTKEFFKSHLEYLQKVKSYEQEAARKFRVNPDRSNVHGGNWLCPDRGLVDFERKVIEELVTNYDIDGIAIDYLGYRNYYACFCDYSNKKRKEFAMKHPKLSEKEVITQFSEQSLVSWTKQLRKVTQDIKPNLKLAIHIYPDFDLNPEYGNKLYVDYCGQTIAWFYKPFWSYGKVYDKATVYKQAEGKYHKYNKYVPFVGVYTEKRLKSPERLRTEIRIAGASGADTIMLAFYGTFAKRPDLAKVVAEELK